MKKTVSMLTVMIFVATLALLGVRVPAANAVPVPGSAGIHGNVVNAVDEDIELEDEFEELEDLEASSGNIRLASDEDFGDRFFFDDDFDDFGFPFGFDFD